MRRMAVATSWLTLISPWMPVMLATSMRQASRRVRAEPLGDHRVRPVVEAAAQFHAAVVEDRHLFQIPPRVVLVRVLGEKEETPPRARRGRQAPPGTTRGCRRSGWSSGRPSAASRARARPRPVVPSPRRRRAAGLPRRRSRRCSGGSIRRGRRGSGRSSRPPSDAMWSRCAVMPSRSPPYSWRGVSGPSPITGSSHSAGRAHAGAGRSFDLAKRSGKI